MIFLTIFFTYILVFGFFFLIVVYFCIDLSLT